MTKRRVSQNKSNNKKDKIIQGRKKKEGTKWEKGQEGLSAQGPKLIRVFNL